MNIPTNLMKNLIKTESLYSNKKNCFYVKFIHNAETL